MKIPYKLKCLECGIEQYIDIHLNQTSAEWACSNCGKMNDGMFEPGFSIGSKILYKSRYELYEREDYSMSIILSAMAFDCELSEKYKKWRYINDLQEGIHLTDEELEIELRKLAPIRKKMEAVGKLLDSAGIENFLAAWPEIFDEWASVNNETFISDIEELIFWQRNRIIHSGFTDFDKEQARKIHNAALNSITVLNRMDAAKKL